MTEPRDFYDAANLLEANRIKLLNYLVNDLRYGHSIANRMVNSMRDAILRIGDEIEHEKQEQENREDLDRHHDAMLEFRR